MGADTNPRTGQPYRTERQCWTDLANDADQRATQADSPQGRAAMEENATEFRRLADNT